jgi:hypothetical protein
MTTGAGASGSGDRDPGRVGGTAARQVAADYGVVDEHGHLPTSNRAQFLG